MAVNNNPPINLDPSMDDGHRLTFINQNFHSLADSLSPYIQSDGTTDILLIGKDSTGNYVLKIAKPGFNAFDASNANLIFNSSQDTFKIVQTGSVAFNITTGTSQKVVSHGLGYSPLVLGSASTSFNGGAAVLEMLPIIGPGASAGSFVLTYYLKIATDASNIYFNYGVQTGINFNGTIYYYILQETATL